MTIENGEKRNGAIEREARVVAYVRVSTDEQDVSKQRLKIVEYAHQNALTISESLFLSLCRAEESDTERRNDELLEKLNKGDTLIVSELSRLVGPSRK